MTVPTDEHFDFELQSAAVSECADDSAWAGDDVVKLDDAEVAEIQAGDDKPFHVEFVALYEGLSRNNKVYGPDAIKSCVDAMIGVNMYKGHVEPGTASWKYREPVGRVVAAKLEKINVGGKDVLAAKGKAYITEGDPKLRSDIKKKMAGNVSILGNARMVRKFGETTKTVTEFHKPLKSVDFCNPDTGGLSHAGVTAVVSEMAATVTETETDPNATDHEDTKMAKMTKAELLAEYKAEITELVGEQIEEQIQEIADGRRELATERVDMKAKLEEKDGEVAEMKTERDAAVTERDDYKAKFEQERDARIGAEVTAFAVEHVAEVAEMDDSDDRLVKMAAKRCTARVIDGDLDKSKKDFTTQFKDALEEVSEMASMFGGTPPADDDETPTRRSAGNRKPKKGGTDLSKILSPELAKAHKERAGV